MKYKKNVFSYTKLLGSPFCFLTAWAYQCGRKDIAIPCLFVLFLICVFQFVISAKFKQDIFRQDTPFLLKLSNWMFGLAILFMNLCVCYVNRR